MSSTTNDVGRDDPLSPSAAPPAVRPPPARANYLRTREDWQAVRDACLADPGAFHGGVAKREIHWFDDSLGPHGAWLAWDDGTGAWHGFDARNLAPVVAPYEESHEPWDRAFDDTDAPFYRWFSGGLTNACFNEVDRHVAAGRGAQAAIIWDSPMTGRVETITYAGLQDRVARTAGALAARGVARGDRVVIYMPMVPEAAIAMLACARLGAVHSVVFGGFAAAELAARIADAKPRAIISASCGLEPGRIVKYKPLLDAAIGIEPHNLYSVLFM